MGSIQLELESAAAFIAEIVRQGIVFEARQDGNYVTVTFKGGF